MLAVAAPLAALLALASAAEGRADEGLADDRLDLWAEAGAGADSNPARAPGAAQAAHPFASLLGRARLRLEGEAGAVTVAWSEAARRYPDAGEADALASRLDATGRLKLRGGVSVALTGAASDYREQAGQLDRHTLRGEGSLGLRRDPLQLTLAGGWSLFAPREPSLRPFRSQGPEGWLRASWAPFGGQQLSAAAGLSRADFPGWAALGAPGRTTRADEAVHLSAEWAWRGAALTSLGWAFTQNRSTAPGGDFARHRLAGSAALGLPLELTLAARLALQWTRYPDPLLLAAQLKLAEGQESLDSAELRLTRPLHGPLEASLSLAWYRAQAVAGVAGSERRVATLALGWRGGVELP